MLFPVDLPLVLGPQSVGRKSCLKPVSPAQPPTSRFLDCGVRLQYSSHIVISKNAPYFNLGLWFSGIMFVLHQYINSEHRLTPSDSLSMVYEDLLQRQRSLITWEWSGVRFPASPIANVKCIHISHFFWHLFEVD